LVVRTALSSQVAEGEATTQQLSAGTFVAGTVDETDGFYASTSLTATSSTELEGVYVLRSADLIAGDTVGIRIQQGNFTALGTYTATPSFTVSGTGLTIRGEASNAVNTAGANTPSVSTPAGTQVGDIILCICANDWFTAATLLTPTGTAASSWTLQHTYDGGSNANHVKVWTAPAIAAGAQTVNYAYGTPGDGSEERYIQIIVFDANVAFDAAVSSTISASTAFTSPTVNAAGIDDVLVVNVGTNGAAGVSNFTMDAALTILTERDVGTFSTLRSGYQQLSASGATGTRTNTCSVARTGHALSVTMKSAALVYEPQQPQPYTARRRASLW
jgi:hypothetical protein